MSRTIRTLAALALSALLAGGVVAAASASSDGGRQTVAGDDMGWQ
ncbi:hypothetical protein ACFQ6B_30800 [Streptomyces wedmorensis]|uniref:Uncharacterized protein n=1 Tax=Streptomyces wedmorensis TaxID=43759 RepID=A0ABW6IZ04_STRWE|nr:hypothetical protein [Streptomyces sp. SS]